MLIGDKLKELRAAHESSLQHVAKATGLSKSHIWEIENGNVPRPSVQTMLKLANHFGVTVENLADEQPDEDQQIIRIQRDVASLDQRDRDLLDCIIQIMRQRPMRR